MGKIGTGAGGGRVTTTGLLPENIRAGETVEIKQGSKVVAAVAGKYAPAYITAFVGRYTGPIGRVFVLNNEANEAIEFGYSAQADTTLAKFTSYGNSSGSVTRFELKVPMQLVLLGYQMEAHKLKADGSDAVLNNVYPVGTTFSVDNASGNTFVFFTLERILK